MTKSTLVLYNCVRDRFVKVTWAHKIQEKQGDIYLFEHKTVKNVSCMLSVLTAGGALTLLCDGLPAEIAKYATIGLSAILSFLSIRFKDDKLKSDSVECKRCAAKLHHLRNQYDALMTDIVADVLSDTEIREQRDMLGDAENEIYSAAPHTGWFAKKIAEHQLKDNKESLTEQSEIKAMVRDELIVK
jgi:hypothetical protein